MQGILVWSFCSASQLISTVVVQPFEPVPESPGVPIRRGRQLLERADRPSTASRFFMKIVRLVARLPSR